MMVRNGKLCSTMENHRKWQAPSQRKNNKNIFENHIIWQQQQQQHPQQKQKQQHEEQ